MQNEKTNPIAIGPAQPRSGSLVLGGWTLGAFSPSPSPRATNPPGFSQKHFSKKRTQTRPVFIEFLKKRTQNEPIFLVFTRQFSGFHGIAPVAFRSL